jgi:hypothetical protein
MNTLHSIGHGLWMSFVMFWDIFWGLCLGFIFSAIIEEIVSKDEMSKLLPDDTARSIHQALMTDIASGAAEGRFSVGIAS